jgi:putative transposase
MVASVRQGNSLRSVARQFGENLSVVQRWVERAGGRPLDLVDWADLPRSPHAVANRTDLIVEELVLALRKELREQSALGEYGAAAIHEEMVERGFKKVPAIRTINRILERKGAFDGRSRVRRAPPPLGWYLPKVASGKAELDQFDAVIGLVIEGGIDVEVFNAISLHGGLVGSWPVSGVSARLSGEALVEHWRAFGCPTYAQFDNDTRFQGPHQHPDVISRVMRICLSLGVTPVFAPPRETGFQASIESYNGRWQQKVWDRSHHESLEALQALSERYVGAARRRSAQRQEGSPPRWPFPEFWKQDLQIQPAGSVIYLRRTDEHGRASLLGHTFKIDEHWQHRLVRAEVQLPEGPIRFYGLRRREPDRQPLLNEVPYRLPQRPFRE